MSLYSMKEIWTPLKWVGIKFFKTLDEGGCYIKENRPGMQGGFLFIL
ncbi:hypothetical protein L2D08_01765 [Domibacillus sp. PGB-M46]|nr:hypothetical protein [Domibacillus sp. PGB-M46]MCI2253087.1 hypothetical protein [Domibacillus sp. PGB-M46]